MTPAHSWPGMAGQPVRSPPAIILRSGAQMPQAVVRMRTWPGPGVGVGQSRSSSCPGAVFTMAFMGGS